MDFKLKFIYKSSSMKTIHVIDNDSIALDELLERFKEFCLGIGYQPNNVKCIQYVEEDTLDTYEE